MGFNFALEHAEDADSLQTAPPDEGATPADGEFDKTQPSVKCHKVFLKPACDGGSVGFEKLRGLIFGERLEGLDDLRERNLVAQVSDQNRSDASVCSQPFATLTDATKSNEDDGRQYGDERDELHADDANEEAVERVREELFDIDHRTGTGGAARPKRRVNPREMACRTRVAPSASVSDGAVTA